MISMGLTSRITYEALVFGFKILGRIEGAAFSPPNTTRER
jgi:hypothetical protein